MNTANRKAFLDTLAHSEIGPAVLAQSDNGYNVIVGSRPGRLDLFTSYADHPRRLVSLLIRGRVVKSTAAGRYQILARYFDHYRRALNLPDFGPRSQDLIALQLIEECHAMHSIDVGDFEDAIHRCRSRWASLPGAGYGQHENEMDDLRVAYIAAGGQAVS